MLNEKDLTIYEYRRQKDIRNYEYVMNERLYGEFQKFSIRTVQAGYIDCYLYLPEKLKRDERLPVVINLHGGGFVLGYPEQDGIYCQNLANVLNCAVINIDYALAPEFKFPIAIETTYEVIRSIMISAKDLSLDRNNLSIIGHSAGGTIACALALMDQEKREINFKKMVLNYPCLDLAEFVKLKRQNKISDLNSRYLDYAEWYLEKLSDAENPYVSPIYGDLSKLPETFILAAEFDPLMNQTIKFYDKAKRVKADIRLKIYKNSDHGFTHKWFDEYNAEKSEEAWMDIESFLTEKSRKYVQNEANRSSS